MDKAVVATIIFVAVLLIFAVLDILMIISLVRPGDERGQVIVWKASAFTLLGMTGALIIEVIESIASGQEMAINPFVHLTATGIVYFGALLFFKNDGSPANMFFHSSMFS